MKDKTTKTDFNAMQHAQGKYVVEIFDEDKNLINKIEQNNAVKTECFDRMQAAASANPAGISTSGMAFGKESGKAAPNINLSPKAVLLLNDASAQATSNVNLQEGEIVGYYDIMENNADQSHALRGNRALDFCEVTVDNENETITYSTVGEFGGLTGNGQFNKIALACKIGASTTLNTTEYDSKILPSYLGADGESGYNAGRWVTNGSHLGGNTLGPSSKFVFGDRDTDDITVPLDAYFGGTGDRTRARRRLMGTCSGAGRIFTIAQANLSDNILPLTIFELTRDMNTVVTDESMIPAMWTDSANVFPVTFGHISLHYNVMQDAIYISQTNEGASQIKIAKLSNNNGVWTLGSPFNLTMSLQYDSYGDAGYAVALNKAGDKYFVGYRNESNSHFVVVKADIDADAGTCTEIETQSYTGQAGSFWTYSFVHSICALTDDKVLIMQSQTNSTSSSYAGLEDRQYKSDSARAPVRTIHLLDLVTNDSHLAGRLCLGDDDESSSLGVSYHTCNVLHFHRGQYYSGFSNAYMLSALDSTNGDLNTFTTDYGIAKTRRIAFTPISAGGIIASSLLGDQTKVEGQTMKVTYSITVPFTKTPPDNGTLFN